MKLHPNVIEAVNRAEATARLLRLGFMVYGPEADIGGEDMVLRAPPPSRHLLSVQLKARLTVDQPRYGGRDIWMLFPARSYEHGTSRDWYLIPHDTLFAELIRRTNQEVFLGRSSGYVPRNLLDFLARYRLPIDATTGLPETNEWGGLAI